MRELHLNELNHVSGAAGIFNTIFNTMAHEINTLSPHVQAFTASATVLGMMFYRRDLPFCFSAPIAIGASLVMLGSLTNLGWMAYEQTNNMYQAYNKGTA